ncbi:hypothetical protein GOBAR_DD28102 [Gossypium barbadense]|nr:hypothetical protein GOBAR_DD28102 [Gossypium barbadense]
MRRNVKKEKQTDKGDASAEPVRTKVAGVARDESADVESNQPNREEDAADRRDVHETAAGALWNLAFYRDNALRIIQDDGVQPLVHLCSSSNSKMARFMAALALVYMFDGRCKFWLINLQNRLSGASGAFAFITGSSKSLNIDGVGRMALKHVEEFVSSFYEPQTFNAAAATLVPTALAQIVEAIRIPETGHLRCSMESQEVIDAELSARVLQLINVTDSGLHSQDDQIGKLLKQCLEDQQLLEESQKTNGFGFDAVFALAKLMNVSEDESQLSAIARQGSGSACRSLFCGFVKWIMGKISSFFYLSSGRVVPLS